MYKLIRFVHHLLRCGASDAVVRDALIATLTEEMEDRAVRIMRYSSKGFRRTTTVPTSEYKAARRHHEKVRQN